MKGVCEDCGTYDELYEYGIIDYNGNKTKVYICRDCLEEMSERDHDIYKE